MKTLIILAHPDITNSRVNKAWIAQAAKYPDRFEIRELYKLYADFNIDAKKEQETLEKFDKVVIEFPLFWYSYPPLLKKWFDDVFAYGWAYGSTGGKLKGKKFALAVSVGDDAASYEINGHVGVKIEEILSPFRAALNFTGAVAMPNFVSFGFSFDPSAEIVEKSAKEYIEFLLKI